jgi:hypothetical protein
MYYIRGVARILEARSKGDCARKFLNRKPHPLIKSHVHVYVPFELELGTARSRQIENSLIVGLSVIISESEDY